MSSNEDEINRMGNTPPGDHNEFDDLKRINSLMSTSNIARESNSPEESVYINKNLLHVTASESEVVMLPKKYVPKVMRHVELTTDEKLHELLDSNLYVSKKFNDKTGWSDLCKLVTDLSVSEFYDEFFCTKAKFSMVDLSEQMKHTLVEVSQPWKKNVMIITCSVPVAGVPFISSTRAIKTVSLIKKTETELVIEIDVKTLDAPYSDTFSCKEIWIILS